MNPSQYPFNSDGLGWSGSIRTDDLRFLECYDLGHCNNYATSMAAKTRRSSNAQLADAEDMKGASQLKDTNFLNDEKGYKLSAYGFGHIKEDHTKLAMPD
uniref:Uncharacterized protein n=1 Tax=Oryza nivara TaxID=4536 RepID=A0A0E0GJ02_ORYNI